MLKDFYQYKNWRYHKICCVRSCTQLILGSDGDVRDTGQVLARYKTQPKTQLM